MYSRIRFFIGLLAVVTILIVTGLVTGVFGKVLTTTTSTSTLSPEGITGVVERALKTLSEQPTVPESPSVFRSSESTPMDIGTSVQGDAPQTSPSPYQAALDGPPGTIVVDHTSIELFDRIPETYIDAAEDLLMFFMDRSVGGNIDEGLDCLTYPSDEEAPIGCRRLEHKDPTFTVDPEVLSWARPGGYDRSNWDYQFWGAGCDDWSAKVNCFMQTIMSIGQPYDVVSYQFSYLSVDSGSTIEDQPGGFFADNPNLYDVFDLEAFEIQHPDKVFIYWTTSLARSIGTTESQVFNDLMRAYASTHQKVLFDVADILSHDPDGNPCYDNRDGVPYTDGNKSENYPDDGFDIPAICQHYTTEVNGGHLGSIAIGKIRVAKAFWVLMARIAGWDISTAYQLYLPVVYSGEEAGPMASIPSDLWSGISSLPARKIESLRL